MKIELSLPIFEKKPHKISNLMKIRPVGAGFFHEDRWMGGWIDMKKLIVDFRNFIKTLKKETF
jgi:hypothetical protein